MAYLMIMYPQSMALDNYFDDPCCVFIFARMTRVHSETGATSGVTDRGAVIRTLSRSDHPTWQSDDPLNTLASGANTARP